MRYRDHANLHIGSTLQMHPLDGILTNTLPLLIAVALVPVHSRWELHAYAAYKTAQELFGHCGCHIKVTILTTVIIIIIIVIMEIGITTYVCLSDNKKQQQQKNFDFIYPTVITNDVSVNQGRV
jgi:uncharacterized membrane protein